MNKIKKAFDTITADGALKNDAMDYISKRRPETERTVPVPLRRCITAAICCAFLALGLFGGYTLALQPVSYISIDINPSVELSLNRLDRVISADAYNDDAYALLQGKNLKWMTYQQAIEEITDAAEESDYLNEQSYVDFTVISPNKETIMQGIENCSACLEYSHSCHDGDIIQVQTAHESGLSFGKYRAYLALKEIRPETTVEEVQAMTMHDLNELLNACSGDENACENTGCGEQENTAGEDSAEGAGGENNGNCGENNSAPYHGGENEGHHGKGE